MAAAAQAGVDLGRCADITLLAQPLGAAEWDRLVASVDAYVPVHRACAGHARLARRVGTRVVDPSPAGLAGLRSTRAAA